MSGSIHPDSGPPADFGGISRRNVLRAGAGMSASVALMSLPVFRPASADAATITGSGTGFVPESEATTLWYDSPGDASKIIEEGLPLGNGRLGVLTTSDPGTDTFLLTDTTLWTGGANDTLNSAGQLPYGNDDFGTVSILAKVILSLPTHSRLSVSNYRRQLDLSNGIVTSTYRLSGVGYRRTVLASHPDDVVVIALSQDGGGTFTGGLTLAGTHGETVSADGRSAHFAAALANNLSYACVVTVTSSGGKLRVSGGEIEFTDCPDLLIAICGGTNYAPVPSTGFRDHSIDPLDIATGRVHRAVRKGVDKTLRAHVADYRQLAGRLSLSLGISTTAQRALTTSERIAVRASSGQPDPELEASYLQFGRYLMIAASRGAVPINLQGPWLDTNYPAWMSDYHTDINLQMNYWLADRAALPDCSTVLADYCLAQLPGWTSITQRLFNDPRNGSRNSNNRIAGWTLAFSTNIYGGGGWGWNPAGNAWLCNTLFNRFEFTQDTAYLAKIYPLLKGACDFWAARLITTTVTDEATGQQREVLVDDHDWSPEHGPYDAIGITYAQELVWQLFGDLRTAADRLGKDQVYAAKIDDLRSRLYLPQVSPTSGWLEEWMTPDDLGEPGHRHLSPLIGLFPGDRLAPDHAPAHLVEAATKLLTARGMSTFGWGMAWRSLCWARLKNPVKAYQAYATVLQPSVNFSNGSAINFLDMMSFGNQSSTFQIDANLGAPTAVLEMLVYSRPGVIELLPATPTAWSDGAVAGVGARGGFTVDITWTDRQVTSATVHSVGGRETEIRFGDWSKTVVLARGRSITVRPPRKNWPQESTTAM